MPILSNRSSGHIVYIIHTVDRENIEFQKVQDKLNELHT